MLISLLLLLLNPSAGSTCTDLLTGASHPVREDSSEQPRGFAIGLWPGGANPESHDYYENLGVGRAANAKEIRKAYRELARFSHPDQSGGAGPEARKTLEEAFKVFAEAYGVLGDPVKRKAYDERGERYTATRFEPPPPGDFQMPEALWNQYRSILHTSREELTRQWIAVDAAIVNAFNLGLVRDSRLRKAMVDIVSGRSVPHHRKLLIECFGHYSVYPEFREALRGVALRELNALSAIAKSYSYFPDSRAWVLANASSFSLEQWNAFVPAITALHPALETTATEAAGWLLNRRIPMGAQSALSAGMAILGSFYSRSPIAKGALIRIANKEIDVASLFSQPSSLALKALLDHYDDPAAKEIIDLALRGSGGLEPAVKWGFYADHPELWSRQEVVEEIRRTVEEGRGFNPNGRSPGLYEHPRAAPLSETLLRLYARLGIPKNLSNLMQLVRDDYKPVHAAKALAALELFFESSAEVRAFVIRVASEDTYYFEKKKPAQQAAVEVLLGHRGGSDVEQALEGIVSRFGHQPIGKHVMQKLHEGKQRGN